MCRGCGHLYNRSFDESRLDYDASYENTLHYSPSFRAFAGELADRLVADHGLQGSAVAELGSGPGHFLSMLCERGATPCYGFDPSYDPERVGTPRLAAVEVSTEQFPTDGSLEVALAYSQHVLEHLEAPAVALEALRSSVARRGGAVYTEVPNGRLMIERCALWDLIYEHLSYFVPTSLDLVHRRAALVSSASGASFGEQFLWCEAVAGPTSDHVDIEAVDEGVQLATRFGDAARRRIDEARHELHELTVSGPVVLWGAGSKGMTYLNAIDIDRQIAGVVDINRRKDGWGVPGTSHVIGGADQLTAIDPAVVLLANPAYLREVEDQVRALGCSATVIALWE